jgi:CRP-like cAMP-binding protein
MDRQAAQALLLRHIREIEPMTPEDFMQLVSSFSACVLRKGEYFTRQHEVCTKFAFVATGCFRAFSTNERGEEYTMYFAFSEWWIGDKTSFYSESPARFSIQALEESEVLVCHKRDWERSLAEIGSFERFYRTKVRRSYEATQQRLIEAHTESAEEKYVNLVRRAPEIVARIPQKFIASYLGIQPPSLSRIRRKLARRRIS